MGLNLGERKLLDKFNLTIQCLDYKYIRNSCNVKEVESILQVLRSGEEGTYPDLINFCENRLRELSPKSELLQVEKPVHISADLPYDQWQELQKNMQDWVQEINDFDADLLSTSEKTSLDISIPPIRKEIYQKSNCIITKKATNTPSELKKSGKPHSYEEWDKYNIEEELKNVDIEVTGKNIEPVSKEGCQKEIALQSSLCVSGMTERECIYIAQKERTKGNEAFKVQDYIEASIYYSRSLTAFPTIAALNNRAQTNIKLKRFAAALLDCNKVMIIEPNNIKALYRRGVAYKGIGKLKLAYMDFQKLLELDPKNKAAKEQICEMEENLFNDNKNIESPILIEEICDSKGSDPVSKELRGEDSSTMSILKNVTQKQCGGRQYTGRCMTNYDNNPDLPPATMAMLNICQKDAFSDSERTDAPVDVEKIDCTNENKPSILYPASKFESSIRNSKVKDPNKFIVEINKKQDKNDYGEKNEVQTTQLKKVFVEIEVKTSSPLDKKSVLSVCDKGIENDKRPVMDTMARSHSHSKSLVNQSNIDKNEDSNNNLLEIINGEIKNKCMIVDLNVQDQNTQAMSKKIYSGDSKLDVKCTSENSQKLFPGNDELNIDAYLADNETSGNQVTIKNEVDMMKNDSTNYIVENFQSVVENFDEITPFKFLNIWHCKSAKTDCNAAAAILMQIPPKQLPAIITNKLDSGLLCQIIRAINIIVKSGNLEKGYNYLWHLTEVPRIKIVSALLSQTEATEIQALLLFLEMHGKNTEHLKYTLLSV